jgi:hypothetical protein
MTHSLQKKKKKHTPILFLQLNLIQQARAWFNKLILLNCQSNQAILEATISNLMS